MSDIVEPKIEISLKQKADVLKELFFMWGIPSDDQRQIADLIYELSDHAYHGIVSQFIQSILLSVSIGIRQRDGTLKTQDYAEAAEVLKTFLQLNGHEQDSEKFKEAYALYAAAFKHGQVSVLKMIDSSVKELR